MLILPSNFFTQQTAPSGQLTYTDQQGGIALTGVTFLRLWGWRFDLQTIPNAVVGVPYDAVLYLSGQAIGMFNGYSGDTYAAYTVGATTELAKRPPVGAAVQLSSPIELPVSVPLELRAVLTARGGFVWANPVSIGYMLNVEAVSV